MAQHDYVIDNSTGANVRADLNNALQAIVTNNSGSSAPSATFPFMLFADSSAGTMKIRNAADNAFIELFQLDGTFTLEDGSASTPALAFRDDLNTGIFSGGNNEFNISTDGTERFVITSSGAVGIGELSPSQKLQVSGDSGDACLSLLRTNAASNDNAYGHVFFENSSDVTLASISARRESASDDAYLQFSTTTTGGSVTERMRIASSGNVGIGTTSPASIIN